MQEEEKDKTEGLETPTEELLSTADPPGPEPGEDKTTAQEESEGPQSDWNYQIPYAVAEMVWPNDPATRASYINRTAPILNLVEFHTCLGPMGQLPPTARLIIGCAAIVGGVVVIKVVQARKEKDDQEGKTAVLRETAEEAEDDQLSSSEKEKTSRDGSQRQGAKGSNEAKNRIPWRK